MQHYRLELKSSLSTHRLQSKMAVLSHWNLSKLPVLGQFIDLDLLPCRGFDLNSSYEDLLRNVIWIQIPMNDQKVEPAMSTALVCNKFSRNNFMFA